MTTGRLLLAALVSLAGTRAAADCTLIDSLPYVIMDSGHYCLGSDFQTTESAITVMADDVTIDFRGHRISGPRDTSTGTVGIWSFRNDGIHIMDGRIDGFLYGIYLSDYVSATQNSNVPMTGGFHRIERMRINESTFRAVRVEGNGNVVRDNVFTFIGGTTTCGTSCNNSYGFAVESWGPGAMITDNDIHEVRGYGMEDVGEGVGISVSGFGSGSVVARNHITNSSFTPDPHYLWAAESRSAYAIWVGGNNTSGVILQGNVSANYAYGITVKRSSQALYTRNVVTGAMYVLDDRPSGDGLWHGISFYTPAILGSPGVALSTVAADNLCDAPVCQETKEFLWLGLIPR